jgi:hypothetical protein
MQSLILQEVERAGAHGIALERLEWVLARKGGAGFRQLKTWLGEYDLLFLRRDRSDALVLLP